MTTWYTYMIQSTKDGSVYTGVTTDVEARLEAHNKGKGAKHTKPRRPYILLYAKPGPSRSEAQQTEWKWKQMTHKEKVHFAKKS